MYQITCINLNLNVLWYAIQKNQLGRVGCSSMVTGSMVVALAHLRRSSSSAWVVKVGALARLYIRHMSMQVDQVFTFVLNNTRDSLSLVIQGKSVLFRATGSPKIIDIKYMALRAIKMEQIIF